jgi:predicted dinucleotide-binding enzyme
MKQAFHPLRYLKGQSKIGIIGSSEIGWTLAVKWAAQGHRVLISNRRGPASLLEPVAQAGVPLTAATVEEAISCEVVLLAVPWIQIPQVLRADLSWNDRILIDPSNIFTSYAPDYTVADLGDDSGSEIIARLAPGARVVKALNTLPASTMFAPPPEAGLTRVSLIAGDDPEALATVETLVKDAGLAPLIAGSLAMAGRQLELRGAFSLVELFTRNEATALLET